MKLADDKELTVITGSVYLAGEALELLGHSDDESQRNLNEWKT